MVLRLALLCLVACGSTREKSTPVEAPAGGSAVERAPPAMRPVAIAIVFSGWEMWIGNDELAGPEEHERYPGVLRPFQEGLGRLQLTDFPAGSQAAVITYTDTATTRHPMQPIEKLGAAAFGQQKDYFGVIDRDLVGGVKLGLDELAKVKDARRILVVIGDGTDTIPARAKAELPALAARAVAEKVEVVSLVYKAMLSSPATPIVAFDPGAQTVNTVDGIAEQLAWLFARVKKPPEVARRGGAKGLALALLVNGSEIWLGNDDFTPANDPSRYEGALKPIRAALETSMTGFPAGSQVMLLTYASQARVRAAATPVESFDVRALGVQRDYYGAIGTELVGGVTFALTELVSIDAKRRVLVILGDGTDTNPDAAQDRLRQLAKRAAEHRIEVYALVLKGALSDENTVVTAIDRNARIVPTAGELTSELSALLATLRRKP